MKTMSKIGFVVSALMLAATVNASIVTNFYDDFSGSAATQLSNSVPDIRPGTEVWNSAVNIFADGHTAYGTVTRGAFLPFVMNQGKIYTFTADVTINDPNPASNTWAMIGIRTNNSLTSGNPAISSGPAFFLMRRNGALGSSNTGGTSTTTTDVGVATSLNLGIIVDTTAASATDWTISFTTNGALFGAANQPLNDTTIVDGSTYYWTIGVQSYVTATFDNVLVTEQIPEPTTIGLFSISGIALLWTRRHFMSR